MAAALLTLSLGALQVQGVPISGPQEPRALECVEAQWYHILLFFLVNYALHAMTVTSVPGEKFHSALLYNLGALLLPLSGAVRGIDAIRRGALFGATQLEQAQRAGALCVVARDYGWRPKEGEVISGCRC
jgi:hypothetical protein